MKPKMRSLAAALAVLGIAGCADERFPESAGQAAQAVPPEMKATTVTQQHTAYLAPGGTLSGPELQRVWTFFNTVGAGNPYGVHLILESNAAPADLVPITRVALNFGIVPSKIERQPVTGQAAPGRGMPVVLVASVSRAVLPECPRMTVTTIDGNENEDGSNFGCSVVTDLEAQVADPRDLVQGESGGSTDAVLTDAAIQRLLTNQVKPLKIVSTKSSGG